MVGVIKSRRNTGWEGGGGLVKSKGKEKKARPILVRKPKNKKKTGRFF